MKKLTLRHVEDRAEALELAPHLDRAAAEAMNEFRDTPLPPDVGRAFIERHFEAPAAVVLVAEAAGQLVGFCVTGPLDDPLTGEVTPMIVLLHVDVEHRHRGVARALAEEARRKLAARGLGKLAARAGHNDDALISMGERWGYLRHWELMLHE